MSAHTIGMATLGNRMHVLLKMAGIWQEDAELQETAKDAAQLFMSYAGNAGRRGSGAALQRMAARCDEVIHARWEAFKVWQDEELRMRPAKKMIDERYIVTEDELTDPFRDEKAREE